MKLSIIIPTLNEGQHIGRLLQHLLTNASKDTEIIVVDGGSKDTTLSILKCNKVKFIETKPSRAGQMNLGAKEAKGNILYFIHADTIPPKTFEEDIKKAVTNGKESGCYKFKFDSEKWQLKVNAYFTQFKILIARGGDQSLFIKASLFQELGMYDEEMVIMEEYPLIEKLMERKTFKVMQKNIVVSARKYDNVSWRQVSSANIAAFKMYKKGKDSNSIKEVYQRLLRPRS